MLAAAVRSSLRRRQCARRLSLMMQHGATAVSATTARCVCSSSSGSSAVERNHHLVDNTRNDGREGCLREAQRMSRSGGRITRISSPLGSNSSMRFFSSAASAEDDGAFAFANFHSGPALMLGVANLGHHAHSSVVATAGTTVVLSTVARGSEPILADGSESFLTVEYRQRTAAVGQIPQNRQRSDAGRLSHEEILASRAIDRSLRPLLEERDAATGAAMHYHVHAAVQCVDILNSWGSNSGSGGTGLEQRSSSSGHPVSTALNAASAALAEHLTDTVAATVLAVLSDGSIVQDPGPEHRAAVNTSTPAAANKEEVSVVYCVGELLYAGTRTHALMMEWTSVHESLPEAEWPALLQLAAAALLPILDTIEELQVLKKAAASAKTTTTILGGSFSSDDDAEVTAKLRASLGLPPLLEDVINADDSGVENTVETISYTVAQRQEFRKEQLKEAIQYCRQRLGTPSHRLFGVRDFDSSTATADNTMTTTRKDVADFPVFVHRDAEEILSKSHRGRRETIMNREIVRLVDEYLDNSGLIARTTTTSDSVESTADDESATTTSKRLLDEADRKWMQQKAVYHVLRHALWETSSRYGTRADGRRGVHIGQGWKTVRPVRLTVPALPDAVHGSALFARGDTQVLCTVTLGAPREGQPLSDPFQPTSNPKFAPEAEFSSSDDETSFDKLPVGSLRFLRTQEALESDLNSRKSKADKERTGESGSLAEVKRAFLQYDFPAYSTGEVPKKGGIDRRSIGHGALAERAILPLLPDQHDFPYSIRMTSEVTDSNGSSSMASVCGATLALLDAGVPLKAPVAGVSIGLAVCNDDDFVDYVSDGKKYSLLLDITGTEDHYGAMDFKIAGTRNGVTAVQLDVKQPLPVDVLIQALHLAKSGRKAILAAMREQSKEAFGGFFCRPEPKESAPRVEVVRFDPNRKRDLVGPGGVVLRQLEDRYGVSLDLTQEGQCLLFGANREMVEKAKWTVMDLVADVVEGEVYTGTVIEIKDFGAVVELLRNKEGLLHVSELSTDDDEARRHVGGNAGFVNHHLRVGQKIEVLCIGVDPIQGSVKLSRKALLEQKKKVYSGGVASM